MFLRFLLSPQDLSPEQNELFRLIKKHFSLLFKGPNLVKKWKIVGTSFKLSHLSESIILEIFEQ